MSTSETGNACWMLLADLHFNQDNLDRNRDTFSWIVSEFARIRPRNVVILGDVVHTRGQIHLRTYHEIVRLLRSFHSAAWAPHIHILIGNHDMLDKHSRRINSMEVFDFAHPRLVVYAEVTEALIDGVRCIFVPYHEDQTVISEHLNAYPSTEREHTIVFAHAALEGAIINGISDHSNFICKSSNGLTVGILGTFRQTFLGHFHHHRTYGGKKNVTYVGSPTQFNFGDAGDVNRGFVIYNPAENQHTFIRSPHAVHFVRLTWDEARDIRESPPTCTSPYENKFVQVHIPASATSDGSWNIDLQTKIRRNLRTNWAVARVQFARQAAVSLPRDDDGPQVDRPGSVKSSTQGRSYILSAMEDFLKRDMSADTSVNSKRLKYIQNLIEGYHSKTVEPDDAKLFVADLSTLTMKNFMGVNGSLTIDFDRLEPGIWLIRGRNGAGKSTFLEAIAWCLYGETFRQCNAHDIVNTAADKMKRGCEVTIRFSNGCVVKRSRISGKPALSFARPSSKGEMEERGVKSVGQAELDTLLNIGWKKFARSIMLSSSTTLNFTTSKEAEKRSVIEHLLGFDVFAAYTAITDTDMKQVRVQLDELLLQTARVEERSKAVFYRIAEQEGLKREIEEEYSSSCTRVAQLDKDLAEIDNEISRLDAASAGKSEQRERAQNHLNEAVERQVLAQALFTSKLDELDTLRCEMETEKEALLEKSQTQITTVECEIRKLRATAIETQAVIDTHFSAYMCKCDELSLQESAVQDLVMHQRKIDIQTVDVKNSIDKLAILQSELENMERKVESIGLYRIEKAATRIRDGLKEKDSSGVLAPDLQSIEEDIIQPLRRMIATNDDEFRKIKLLEEISAVSLSVERGQKALVDLGQSDPSIDETFANLRNRSRFFHDVDPQGFVAWDTARSKKTQLVSKSHYYENELHSLCSLREKPQLQGRMCEEFARADKSLALQRKGLALIQQEIDKIKHFLKSIECDDPLVGIRHQRSSIEVRIKEIEAVNTQLQRQIETTASNIDRTVQVKSKLQVEMDTLKSTQSELELYRAVTGFWRDKLKCTKANGVRAHFIERKIHEINEEIERNMYIFGDDGDGVFIDLGCKLTSSLSLVEKRGAIPFAHRSDGQKKRCSLALFFAILKKAKESGGFYPKFMFMDEVYDALDEQGQLAVHRWIALNTSKERREKTFVITHSHAVESLHKTHVKGVISATWCSKGSSYEIENDKRLTEATFIT